MCASTHVHSHPGRCMEPCTHRHAHAQTHVHTHTSAAAHVHNHTDVPSHVHTGNGEAHRARLGAAQLQLPASPPGTRLWAWAGGDRGTHREVMQGAAEVGRALAAVEVKAQRAGLCTNKSMMKQRRQDRPGQCEVVKQVLPPGSPWLQQLSQPHPLLHHICAPSALLHGSSAPGTPGLAHTRAGANAWQGSQHSSYLSLPLLWGAHPPSVTYWHVKSTSKLP